MARTVKGQGSRLGNQLVFAGTEYTGSGAEQTIPHMLPRTPDIVSVQGYGASVGSLTVLTWDADNIYVTFENAKTYSVKAELF